MDYFYQKIFNLTIFYLFLHDQILTYFTEKNCFLCYHKLKSMEIIIEFFLLFNLWITTSIFQLNLMYLQKMNKFHQQNLFDFYYFITFNLLNYDYLTN